MRIGLDWCGVVCVRACVLMCVLRYHSRFGKTLAICGVFRLYNLEPSQQDSINLLNEIEWQAQFTACLYPFRFFPSTQFNCHSNTLRLLFENTHLAFWVVGTRESGRRKKIRTHFLLGFRINRFVILWMKPALNNSHFKNHKWAHPDKRVPAACRYSRHCAIHSECVCVHIFDGSPFLILKAVNEAAHTLKWHKTVRQRFCGTLKMKTNQKEIST